MAIVTNEEAKAVMKRCQRGTRNYDEANNLHAECYGTIGALAIERNKLKRQLIAALNELGRPLTTVGENDESNPKDPARSNRAGGF